ncbi:MAG: hypothetical protein R3C15_18705 [Thermoleophilia bacterium]
MSRDETSGRPGGIRPARERRTWQGAVCGADAGSIVLYDDGRLERDAFTSGLSMRGGPGVAAALDDAAALFALDLELVPWWCPGCAASYCGAHWSHWPVFDDEGFLDCIRGCCPHGHERMLED